MTPQRPKKKAIQQNDAAVKQWLGTDYPAIAERAKQENAAIFWEDETAVQQDANWVRGYAPRGCTPTILHDRRACYGAPVMISAVNNQGLTAFAFQRSAVRRYSFIRFLHRLIKDYRKEGRKLFVICDNCKIHHAKLVLAWCRKYEAEIELFFLPADSPELNPDEFLNRQLKTELRQKGPKNHEETLALTKEITASLKEQLEPIRACFQNESTLYARAADIRHVFIDLVNNDFWLALPIETPHIRFLFVGLAICYRLPSSDRCLPDSAESLDLPLLGRPVDFHHINTRALPGAPKKTLPTESAGSVRFF